MAHSLSAKKRIRQNVKRHARNRWHKVKAKSVVKTFEETLESGDKVQAAAQLKQVYSTLDKIAAKGTLHKNTVARKKARLAKRLAKAQKA